MGCNCGKGGKANVSAPTGGSSSGSYSLTTPDGTKMFYETETAARAANARSGGRGLVRKV